MQQYYAGIGSRETPIGILELMEAIAYGLGAQGYICRTGGAPGADTAFQKGAARAKHDYRTRYELFLPWARFNNQHSEFSHPPEPAYVLAKTLHPAWDRLSRGGQALMARNSQQILGPQLTEPSAFVICWTPDGCIHRRNRSARTGGTGQAITLASQKGIPIFNLQRLEHFEYFIEYLKAQEIAYTKDYFEAHQAVTPDVEVSV